MKIKKLRKSLSLPRDMEFIGQNNPSSIFNDIYQRSIKNRKQYK